MFFRGLFRKLYKRQPFSPQCHQKGQATWKADQAWNLPYISFLTTADSAYLDMGAL